MKVLYVENNSHDADVTRRWLGEHAPQIALETVARQSEAVARLTGPDVQSYDVVVTGHRLAYGNGLSLLKYIREQGLPLAVVMLTAADDEETAVVVMEAGADNYVAKRKDYLERLPSTLESALQHHHAHAAQQTRP